MAGIGDIQMQYLIERGPLFWAESQPLREQSDIALPFRRGKGGWAHRAHENAQLRIDKPDFSLL